MRTAKTVIVRPVGTDTSTEIRIWAREDAIEQVAFAVEVEDYFQVPFPLPKLDLVGLPDFASGNLTYWFLIFTNCIMSYRFAWFN